MYIYVCVCVCAVYTLTLHEDCHWKTAVPCMMKQISTNPPGLGLTLSADAVDAVQYSTCYVALMKCHDQQIICMHYRRQHAYCKWAHLFCRQRTCRQCSLRPRSASALMDPTTPLPAQGPCESIAMTNVTVTYVSIDSTVAHYVASNAVLESPLLSVCFGLAGCR